MTDMKSIKEKIFAIDAMRTISILAVLLIHTTTKVLETTHYDLLTYWPTLFLNQAARFAVPLFFLISGFVLEFNYGQGLHFTSYLKKRFSKILIPYIFWSLIYYVFIYTNNSDNLIRVFLTGNASYQLYFIPTICIFYLLFPVLHRLYKIFANIPVLAILTYLQIQLMNKDYLIHQFEYADPIRILLLGYLYFILGMVAARNKDMILNIASKVKYFLIPVILYLINFIFNEGKARYYLTYNIGSFYSQWRPDILLYTLILGMLLFYAFRNKGKGQRYFEKLSRLSYLGFFIHIIVLEWIWKYAGSPVFSQLTKNPLQIFVFDTFYFTAVTGVSFGAAYLIHKIPRLSRITG